MTNEYDEDLSQNPFFKTFLHNYPELFCQCVEEKWLICIPRNESLPRYTFTLEDFTQHILRPMQLVHELTPCSSSVTITRSYGSLVPTPSNSSPDSSSSSHTYNVSNSYNLSLHCRQPNWNFKTLADANVEYTGKSLFLDTTIDTPLDISNGETTRSSHSSNNNPRSVSVLFEETFYTMDKRKYKVLCISSPLNSQVEAETSLEADSGIWNLTSLRDCIDFLWINGRPKTLETFDANIKLFLHNHRSLEDLPLPVQRDLIYDLYNRCVTCALKSEAKHKSSIKSTIRNEQYSSATSMTNSSSDSKARSNHSIQNFRLATETYVLNGIYIPLMAAISSQKSFDDAAVNKVMRNMADIHPQDLGISNIHWENLSRGRQELARLPMHPTPLGKLKCLRTTMKHLQQYEQSIDENEDGVISTDELLPIWVYLLIKANIGNWMAQLHFLRQFRFSAIDVRDNENSFFIVTLEASLLFLNSGKVTGGLAESERDVGTPYQDYVGEFWLRCLFNNSLNDESILGEMFSAIRHGNKDKLENLIREYDLKKAKDYEINIKPLEGIKLCHPLCNCPNCASVSSPKALPKIESAFELRNEDCGGVTLLHVACIYGRPKIVDFLLVAGSPFGLPDSQGRLPIHYAGKGTVLTLNFASRGHQNALLLLLHAGSPIDTTDHSLSTPLHLASLNGHDSCVKALIYYAEHTKRNLDVSARNCNGDTSLHFASRYGFLGIVQLLVESGASITVANTRQRNPMDVAHDNHVIRILQRSLCRRSLVHKYHGDFVNVEVVPKGTTEGVFMLISDPIPSTGPNVGSASTPRLRGDISTATSKADENENSVKEASLEILERSPLSPRSRRSSYSSQPPGSGTVTRKTSSVITPSFTPSIRESEIEAILNRSEQQSFSRKKRSLQATMSFTSSTEEDNDEMIFHISNTVPQVESYPEHVRKVSVDNLEYAPHILASMAHVGVRRKREYQARELRKLFLAIENGDTPLALFYLGIPTEELETADDIIPGISSGMENCHPLCPCMKCTTKNAGILSKLGVSLDVMSHNGFTVLHLAVIFNNHALVKILLKYGIDASARSTNGGKTALDYAKERYFEDIAVTLQSWCKGLPTT